MRGEGRDARVSFARGEVRVRGGELVEEAARARAELREVAGVRARRVGRGGALDAL